MYQVGCAARNSRTRPWGVTLGPRRQMEIDRIKFLLSSYLRTRVGKVSVIKHACWLGCGPRGVAAPLTRARRRRQVERFPRFVLQDEDLRSRLSAQELDFAKKFAPDPTPYAPARGWGGPGASTGDLAPQLMRPRAWLRRLVELNDAHAHRLVLSHVPERTRSLDQQGKEVDMGAQRCSSCPLSRPHALSVLSIACSAASGPRRIRLLQRAGRRGDGGGRGVRVCRVSPLHSHSLTHLSLRAGGDPACRCSAAVGSSSGTPSCVALWRRAEWRCCRAPPQPEEAGEWVSVHVNGD